jgi:hypothetical protein
MRDMTWTADDVEALARAAIADRPPPAEIMERLGTSPPDDFLTALGRRARELGGHEHIENDLPITREGDTGA